MVLLTALAAGCAAGGHRSGPERPRTLAADSARLLAEAVRRVRPAFATQEEALRHGAYAAPPSAPPALSVPSAAGPAGGRYVIQIAAYRDAAAAEIAAGALGRYFPGLDVRVEEGAGHFRVALAGWTTAADARAALPSVRERFPDAWLRQAVP
jgi:cell division protein FtsN